MRHFEDFVPGAVEDYGPVTVEREAMLAFARAYDPQPMHLDDASEQAAQMGGLIASGWFTAGLNMRMITEHFLLRSAAMGSPGVLSGDWLAPVRAGDRLGGRMEITDSRPLGSRPELGLVDMHFTLTNQAGDAVYRQRGPILFRRREAGAPGPARGASPATREAPEAFPAKATARGFRRLAEAEPGMVLHFGRYHFERDEIIAFAREYDPQPFHLDEAAGKAGLFGGLAASGWHTGAAWMRTAIDFWTALSAEAPLPKRGPGFGFRDLKWFKPVLAGDHLDYYCRVLEARPSASKPGWGILTQRNYALNQHGVPVFAFTGAVLWGLE